MPQGFASVDELFGALHAARDADDEGGLSILDHGLQCADLIKAARPDDVALQVAGLVHDLGWLERAPGGWTLRPDAAHDVDGSQLVRRVLGPRVAFLVGGHVAAKRYLLATDAAYRAWLSARSETTLAFQGGVMEPDETEAFEADPGVGRPGRAPPRRRRGQGAAGRWCPASMPGPARSRGGRGRRLDRAALPTSARPVAVGSGTSSSAAIVGAQSAASTGVSRSARASGSTAGCPPATTATCARVRGPPCVPRRVSSPVNPKARPGSLQTRQHSSASEVEVEREGLVPATPSIVG